jgi:hypothetical protein
VRLLDIVIAAQLLTLALLAGVCFQIGWSVGRKCSMALGILEPNHTVNVLPGATIQHFPGDRLYTFTPTEGEANGHSH